MKKLLSKKHFLDLSIFLKKNYLELMFIKNETRKSHPAKLRMMDQRERRLCSVVVHASVHMKMDGKIAHFGLYRVDGDNGP